MEAQLPSLGKIILLKTLNGNISIEEEIKSRISLGNKAFYANQDLPKLNY
jgi:hypothetical protein